MCICIYKINAKQIQLSNIVTFLFFEIISVLSFLNSITKIANKVLRIRKKKFVIDIFDQLITEKKQEIIFFHVSSKKFLDCLSS